MGFASTYLDTRTVFPTLIKEAPDKQTGIIVVVPAYNEPGITVLLDSLKLCDEPDFNVEVIIVINAPVNASLESQKNNRKSISDIESWKKTNRDVFFRLFVIDTNTSSFNHWGVGLARKTGMDEAIRRFNGLEKPEGVILNLDADCLVEKNYFTSVCNELMKIKNRSACSIYFEHQLSGNDFTEKLYKSIILYELHLRYYFQGLRYSGFPYAFYTIGSAIAVKALPYIKVGGMNRRQAGEDFYFIQKLVPAGGYFSLNTTTIYPSPRTSLRVPFGTGSTISKLMENGGKVFLTYNIQSFKELHSFFGLTDKMYTCKPDELTILYEELPEGVRLFVNEKEWTDKMLEIKTNTSGLVSFQKRFFGWFNMFKIVKYMNYVHSGFFKRNHVENSANELLRIKGHNLDLKDSLSLLSLYRSLEKGS